MSLGNPAIGLAFLFDSSTVYGYNNPLRGPCTWLNCTTHKFSRFGILEKCRSVDSRGSLLILLDIPLCPSSKARQKVCTLQSHSFQGGQDWLWMAKKGGQVCEKKKIESHEVGIVLHTHASSLIWRFGGNTLLTRRPLGGWFQVSASLIWRGQFIQSCGTKAFAEMLTLAMHCQIFYFFRTKLGFGLRNESKSVLMLGFNGRVATGRSSYSSQSET